MADLPAKPSLDHLRRQARDLLRAAQAGDTTAAGRIRAVADALTLASAQLAVAREYGFASWTRLRDEVTARTASLARQAEAFCEASIRDGTGRAARMLAATPELARYSFATAVILGDAGRVRTELGRDPGLATQADTRTGWAPLHAASASRWHRLDPARTEGLLAVARMLLDAGADPNGRTGEAGGHGGWTPLRCAVAGAANPFITRLLLERGAVPGDHDLYLAGFADDNHECLRLLLFHAADVAQLARMALAAPISLNDAEGVHLLLEAGADVTVTGTDRLLAACQDADRAKVERLLAADPGLPGRIPAAQQAAAMIHAAESGNTAAITLLLDLGFPVDACGDDGGTPLHAAAYSGSAPAVRLLLDRGAGVEARDTTWDSTPMEWAAVGSGEQPASHPHPDWTGTVQALLDAGASARDITLSPDDPKPPSPEVAALLRRHGGQ